MKKISKKILGVTFILFIMTMAIANRRAFRNFYSHDYPKFSKQTASQRLVNSVKAIRDRYVKQVKWKTFFVEVNGGFIRLIGKKECNKIFRLNNGMVARTDFNSAPNKSLPDIIKQIVDLSGCLKQLKIPFLYVNCPDKMDPDGTLLPPGVTFYSNQDSDKLLIALVEKNIASLDLRPVVAKTGEDMKRYFFATDHHWNAFGAFKATQALVYKLAEELAFDVSNLPQLDLANWDVITRKNWWLGSEGKRTGYMFSDLDDLDVLMPKFDTCISKAIPSKNEFSKGPFKESVIYQRYIDKRVDLYTDSGYHVFGFDRAVTHYRNEFAPIKKHILVVKDSFGNPLCGYLSTIFTEVDAVDLRHNKETSLLTLLERLRPNIVVMLFNPSSRSIMVSEFGDLKSIKWRGEKVIAENVKMEVPLSKERAYNYKALFTPLQNGETYVVEVGNVEVLKGRSEGFSLALYCPETKKVETRPMFDLMFANNNGGARWEFKVPDKGEWQILFYAGVASKTQNISLRYDNVKVTQRLK